MSILSADELDAMLAALGVDVVLNGSTIKGIKRAPSIEMFQEDEVQLIGRSVSVLVRSGSVTGQGWGSSWGSAWGGAPGLVNGAAIVVAGETLKVHRFMAESDGSVTRILAVKA